VSARHPLAPEPGEPVYGWIAHLDPAIGRAISTDDLPSDPRAAYSLGVALGQVYALFSCYEQLDRCPGDEPERLLGIVLSGALALVRCRNSAYFVRVLRDEMNRPRGGDDDRPAA